MNWNRNNKYAICGWKSNPVLFDWILIIIIDGIPRMFFLFHRQNGNWLQSESNDLEYTILHTPHWLHKCTLKFDRVRLVPHDSMLLMPLDIHPVRHLLETSTKSEVNRRERISRSCTPRNLLLFGYKQWADNQTQHWLCSLISSHSQIDTPGSFACRYYLRKSV